jgi:peptide-methionine (S)-S-oxide reductase
MAKTTTERTVLAGGCWCFWRMHHLIRRQAGVISTRVGYTDGDIRNATDYDYGTHAIEVIFDPAQLPYRKLLHLFFQIHDPTTTNPHGRDLGARYCSAIFCVSEEQKRVAEETIADVDASGVWSRKVATEVAPAGPFWEAEPEYQDYLERAVSGYTRQFVSPHWRPTS